ncbi:MAG: hypothetical protein AUI09_04845 [Gemmatimonadetes bacterium 13_2_20CM_2_66_5]|nr:MAG: hypothetical protein AUI09_04845 [Gemmatimonadetes bacterium 13_2_20CM_2_66_5]
MTRRPLFYGLCLLVGSLLFGIAGLNHPLLSGEGAAQLATVARTSAWRLIHWSLLFGLAFMYTGLVGVALRHTDTAGATPARAGVAVGAFAFSVWSINILFMVGAGWQLAQAYTASDAGLTGTHAVFVYNMLHPMGLAAERLATFMLGLVAYMFGWTIRNGAIWPKWLAWMAWGVAVADGAVAVVFSEFSPNLCYGQALFVIWLAATAVVMLANRGLGARG